MITKMQRIFTRNSGWLEEADSNLANFKPTNSDLIDDTLIHAIRDARQIYDLALQQEALAWLWICCPDIADELALPTLETALAIAAEKEDAPLKVVDYLHRYSTFSLVS